MVEINYRVVIVGLLCLTAIFISLIIWDNPSDALKMSIIGVMALAIGVIVPTPPVNKAGNFIIC